MKLNAHIIIFAVLIPTTAMSIARPVTTAKWLLPII